MGSIPTPDTRIDTTMNSKRIEIAPTAKGRGVLATDAFAAEETILVFEQNFIADPTTRTLRIDLSRHQISTDPTAPENYINHSCDPNAYIDWDTLTLRALLPIRVGEEIMYNYFTSDWDGEDPFTCLCGAGICKVQIRGFRYLSLEEALRIRSFLSPFLRGKLAESLESERV